MVKRGVLKVSKAWKLAAALAFAAALAGTSVWWGLSRQGEFEWVAQHESSLQAIYASDHVRNRCLLLARFEKMECAVKSRDEHRAYDTNEQGLVAQKTSALWTMIMGCAASLSNSPVPVLAPPQQLLHIRPCDGRFKARGPRSPGSPRSTAATPASNPHQPQGGQAGEFAVSSSAGATHDAPPRGLVSS
jgi:hypothetical protein